MKPTPCPCDPTRDYRACCARLHNGDIRANDAEQLMRSRYSAFVLGLWDYVYATWHPSTRPARDSLQNDNQIKWLSLDIRSQQSEHDRAQVEFIARYKINGRAARLHERSRFVHENHVWLYVDGDLFD